MSTKLANESLMLRTKNMQKGDVSVERQANERLQDKYDQEHRK